MPRQGYKRKRGGPKYGQRPTKRRALGPRIPRGIVNRKTSVQKGTGFAQSQLVKLRFVQSNNVDPSIATFAGHNFRANGPYDADLTGVGHQPLAYDTWSSLYNHQLVVGAKITATFIPRGTDAIASTGVCGVHLSDDGSLPFTLTTTMMEQNNAKWKFLGSIGSGRYPTITHNFNPKTFFSVKDVQDSDKLSSSVNSVPAEQAIFTAFVGPADDTADMTGVTILTVVEYTILFTEPKELTQN